MVSKLFIRDFTYHLPPERIAAYPLGSRDTSKLLVCRGDTLVESVFSQIDEHLVPGSMLVLNNTRVVQARLLFQKETGAVIELFCLEPVSPSSDVHQVLGMPSSSEWLCLIGNARRWKSGALNLSLGEGNSLTATKLGRQGDAFLIRFSWEPPAWSFGQVLELAGQTPLPPYINRSAEPEDKLRYQTVFAREDGSVAAPTAGLHFTPGVFAKLEKKDIIPSYLTLHVGAGTFKPVTAETVDKHEMHREQFSVERSLLVKLAKHNGPLACVGTTSMRTLESLYWIGVRLAADTYPSDRKLYVTLEQWAPYKWTGPVLSKKEAIIAIINYLDAAGSDTLYGETSLMIMPGYSFKMVDVLVTNFHQPGSTLLLLVAAFAGPQWKRAYEYALNNNFRFLSYGDSCLFFRAP